ncbi:galactofuranose ABC transporter, permease protein YjfF [Anaeromassilibacillus senegalensis]|uniref:galactofuranose ABC transporter, permease protein YjfF n=1 Tax=Anaeromassilibacillus senegalensis TaxID=1673717 RepID=UPI00068368ED|nr:galactofuranose ABC transporter, permease protein YjfF [Anaeromassilibacillus senegalensis]
MNGQKAKKKFSIKNISLLITVVLFIVLFGAASVAYDNFFSFSTLFNLLNDNGYLIIASIGITFVLLTGGIDISIASTIAFTCVFSAFLLRMGVPPFVVIPLVLLIGLAFGALMGFMIHYYKLQPFIVTLAGQFFMRGMCAVISTESIPITNEFYKTMALSKITFLGGRIYFYVFIAVAVLIVALFVLKLTKFGRTVYAVGGNEQSAVLMGLPVARTKVSVYAISSFCAALAGVVFSFYTLAGNSLQNVGLELDAISSAVIGGTLLTGGVGNVIGTTVGVLIQGVIQTIVTYQNLNTWWTKVTIAGLLCVFIIIQRLIAIRAEKLKAAG